MPDPRPALLVLGLALPSAAAPPASLPAGRYERSVTHRGVARSYIVHVPRRGPPAGGWPVVLAFHGGGGSAEGMEQMSELHRLGEGEGFVTAYPRGRGRFERRLLTWNGGYCCGYARDQQVDDVGFVAALLDQLDRALPVHHGKVFATGMSNGAIMAYRLASELPYRIAAIAPVAAPLGRDTPTPEIPVPVIHFHGSDDRNAPYHGGRGPRSISGTDFPPVREGLQRLARAYGCPDEPKETRLPDGKDDGTRVRVETWGPGQRGAEVVLYTIEGGSHSWPGGPSFMPWLLGKPSREISANRVMWDFFVKHSRRVVEP